MPRYFEDSTGVAGDVLYEVDAATERRYGQAAVEQVLDARRRGRKDRVKALREHKVASGYSLDDQPVFANSKGGPLDHRNVVRAWHVIRKRAKLADPQPRFHDLRHTAASLLIAERADPVYVARVRGHSSPSITRDVYAGLFRSGTA